MSAERNREHGTSTVTLRGLSRMLSVPADPYRWPAIGFSTLLGLTLPVIMVLVVLAKPEPPPHPWAEAAAAIGVEPDDILFGELTFKSSCSLCHGPRAEGVARLGKPLRNSAFVQQHSDDELFILLTQGRLPSDPQNTTGTLMPARASKGLGDQTLMRVIAFLRAIQDPSQPTASVEAWQVFEGGQGGQVNVAGSSSLPTGVGHDLFVASCSACHGPGGEGMEGLGKPLANSSFVGSKSDAELMAFVKSGRPIWDAENTTGVDMPPKGGNPALSDKQLADIIEYIRALHK